MRQCYSRPLLETADLQCLSIKMFFSLHLHAGVGFYRLGQHGACTYTMKNIPMKLETYISRQVSNISCQ